MLSVENSVTYMSRKGPKVGQGMLDFIEDCRVGVKSHYLDVLMIKR